MSISGFTVFKFYRVAKLHFTTDRYNMIDSQGRANGVTVDAFNRDRKKNFFEYFCTKFDTEDELMQFLIACFVYQREKFIFDKNFAAYHEWIKRKENITEVFKEDIQKISKKYQEMNGSMDPDTKNPILLELFFDKEITIETLRIIEDIHPYLHQWEKDEVIKEGCKNIIRIIKKLEKLVKYDSEKIKEIWNTFMENVDLTK